MTKFSGLDTNIGFADLCSFLEGFLILVNPKNFKNGGSTKKWQRHPQML
jgi:hypothetical protein